MSRQLHYLEKQRTSVNKEIVIVLDSLNDPGNIGMIFRLADNFGAKQIIMTGKMLPHLTIKVHRAARHTHKYISSNYTSDTDALISNLKNEGYHIVALELANTSLAINEFTFKSIPKIALVLGGEEHGVSISLLKQAHVVLHINVFGVSHSMNVSNACSVALFHIVNH